MSMKVQRDYFIAVPYHAFSEALVQDVGMKLADDAKDQFSSFASLLRGLYHERAQEILDDLWGKFLPLCPSSGRGMRFHAALRHKARTAEEQLRHAEELVSMIARVAMRANFSVLGQAEWDIAQSDCYSLDAELDINWDKCDPTVHRRFLAKSPQFQEGAYKHLDRVLVFHRGVGEVERVETFMSQKLNLLITYLLEALRLAKPPRAKKKDDDRNGSSGSNVEYHWVHRTTLRRALPDPKQVLSHLWAKTYISEPCFRDVVTVYFQREERHSAASSRPSQTLHEHTNSQLIIKSFHSVPMADLEMVLPNKTVKFRPLEYVKLAVAVVLIVVFGLKQLRSAREDDSLKKITNTLYHSSLDSDMGVIHDLVESMAEQELKETIGAYWALLASPQPLLEEELDAMVEAQLSRDFGIVINFEASDGLAKLKREGLVEEVDGKWRCVPLDQALQLLGKKRHDRIDDALNSDMAVHTTGECFFLS